MKHHSASSTEQDVVSTYCDQSGDRQVFLHLYVVVIKRTLRVVY